MFLEEKINEENTRKEKDAQNPTTATIYKLMQYQIRTQACI